MLISMQFYAPKSTYKTIFLHKFPLCYPFIVTDTPLSTITPNLWQPLNLFSTSIILLFQWTLDRVIRLYIPYFMSRHRGHIKFLKSLEMCVFCSYNKFIHSHSFNPPMINSLTTFSLLHWLTKSFNNHLKYHYPFEDILTHCESNLFLRYFSISLTFCDSFYGNYDNHHS